MRLHDENDVGVVAGAGRRSAPRPVIVMGEHIDAHVLRKYQTIEKIGKGVRAALALDGRGL